ncbi:MAG: flagellar filament capping protein FliD, partial [Porticoccaceae bacterium]|nr:flagellar filament capping protein FliD [Porticoccaceae bacterium]
TGAENSLEVSVTESGAAGLGQLAFNAGVTNLSETIAGQDALLTINGLAVSSASNTVSGAIEDVGITLLSTTLGIPINISIDRDSASVKNAINGFISSYNSFIETVNKLSSFNPETLQAGILLGDSTLRGVTSKVRDVLSAAIGGSATLQRLTDIGITTGDDGTLAMDTAVLDEVLDNDFDAVAGLFTASATTTDSLISFVSSTQKTQPGTYGVVISQLATQAELQGGGVLPDFGVSTLTIDSDNDVLTLKVDGTTSGEITLTAGVYTSGIDLAAEIETKINADSALTEAGAVVTVTYDVTGNQFVINSTSYGSESTVEITQSDTTSGATLGLSVGAGVSGVDVAGTIGGSKATGLGQTLTGAAGSDTEGLVLDISGGGIGTRGSVAFNRGVAEKLEDLLNVYLGAESLVDLRTDSLSDQIEDIGERRDSLNLRMESFESRTRARFTALDTLLAQLLQTSDFLAQQLTNLPGAISNKK